MVLSYSTDGTFVNVYFFVFALYQMSIFMYTGYISVAIYHMCLYKQVLRSTKVSTKMHVCNDILYTSY